MSSVKHVGFAQYLSKGLRSAICGGNPARRPFPKHCQRASVTDQAIDLTPSPLSNALLQRMHAYWQAANYLSVGQIYLYDNPLLKQPLELAHWAQ